VPVTSESVNFKCSVFQGPDVFIFYSDHMGLVEKSSSLICPCWMKVHLNLTRCCVVLTRQATAENNLEIYVGTLQLVFVLPSRCVKYLSTMFLNHGRLD